MVKPHVTLAPAPQWQHLAGSYDDLVGAASDWRRDDSVPESVADMLSTARSLFIHSYFEYEFLVVATTWSLLALEVALRDVLELDRGPGSPGLGKMIGKAQGRGWFTPAEAEAVSAGKELRDRLIHGTGIVRYTPGMAEPMLRASHAAVADLYMRAAATGKRGAP